jgi:hypothetical protein
MFGAPSRTSISANCKNVTNQLKNETFHHHKYSLERSGSGFGSRGARRPRRANRRDQISLAPELATDNEIKKAGPVYRGGRQKSCLHVLHYQFALSPLGILQRND